MSTLEALLRRERGIVAAGLAALTLLAWFYLWAGAGMGVSALEMTRLAFFPHLHAEPMPGMNMMIGPPGSWLRSPGMAMGDGAAWLTVLMMWWIMMIAMMTPSAAPIVLLYGRVLRHSSAERRAPGYVSSFYLVLGYLGAWLVFSAAAAALQVVLQDTGIISWTMLSSTTALFSSAVLVSAGLYQLSPLKRACLRHCRNPVEFLTRHWRPGRIGAIAMGARHGLWCVGCCAVLMLLLFVGGVMNIAWIAVIALLVLAEKIAPHGQAVSRGAGVVLLVWGAATAIV